MHMQYIPKQMPRNNYVLIPCRTVQIPFVQAEMLRALACNFVQYVIHQKNLCIYCFTNVATISQLNKYFSKYF